jgi:hypothetical protein
MLLLLLLLLLRHQGGASAEAVRGRGCSRQQPQGTSEERMFAR